MNASDIVKSRQNRILFQTLYRPTIITGSSDSTGPFVVSSVTYYPYSSISSSGVSSIISTTNQNYLYKCLETPESYELANDINEGKYLCKSPYCSAISEWNTGSTFISGTCDCNISRLAWKNTNPTTIYSFSSIVSSSVVTGVQVTSSIILASAQPLICPTIELYQGYNCRHE